MRRAVLLLACSIPLSLAADDAWQARPAMGVPRAIEPGAAAVNGRLYMFGGNWYMDDGSYRQEYLRSVEMFDPATNSWSPACDLPLPIAHTTATEAGGKIYIIGGHDGSATYASVWEFDPLAPCNDPARPAYRQRRPMSTSRMFHAAAGLNGKIYVLGGYPRPYVATALRSAEVYDPAADTWTPIQDMSAPRWGFAAASVGNMVYAIGGAGNPEGPYVPPSAEAYDVATGQWAAVTSLPSTTGWGQAAVGLNGRVFVIGGQTTWWTLPFTASTVLSYDPADASWQVEPSMQTRRSMHAATVLDGTIYAVGGNSPDANGTTASAESFQPASCASATCPGDTVCTFNNGDFCGAPVGDVRSCPGVCGTGLCSNGQGKVVLGNSAVFSQESFEVEAQVALTRLPALYEYGAAIASKYVNHSPQQSEWWFGVDGNGGRRWVLTGNGTNGIYSAPNTVQENVAYHVRGVWNGSQGEIWVNGTLVASGPINRNTGPTSTPAIIAGSPYGSPFYGMIDEVRIGCLRPIDTTPPIISPHEDVTVEATSPAGAAVTYISPTTSDAVDGPGVATCSPPSGSTFPLGPSTVTCTAADRAGNVALPVTFTVTVQDTTAPSLSVPPALAAPCTGIGPDGRGCAAVTDSVIASWLASASATDIVDSAPTITHNAPSIFPIGLTTVTFTATDQAGNNTQATAQVRVTYGFGGFRPPLIDGGVASVRQGNGGRTIPVKFTLNCGNSSAATAIATIAVYKILDLAAGSLDVTDLTQDAGNANGGGNVFRYDPSSQQYIYNLSTAGYQVPATYRILVSLDDGTQHSVDFALRP
jgi:N-acetylneuraminic acid mutarotase